jgi:hypothetical protein
MRARNQNLESRKTRRQKMTKTFALFSVLLLVALLVLPLASAIWTGGNLGWAGGEDTWAGAMAWSGGEDTWAGAWGWAGGFESWAGGAFWTD